MNSANTSPRRVTGSYYTPEWLARLVVGRCLGVELPGVPITIRRVLDPACGDGAFVLTALEHLRCHVSDRLSLVRESLFGVDADPVAISALRARVTAWIGGPSVSADETEATLVRQHAQEVQRVVESNFLCGNALLGSDWSMSATEVAAAVPSLTSAMDWASAFPHVMAEGGFDLVVGNPPYRRELNAKADFDLIAASPLGQRWRRPRMDLWHYFLHRGLNLLKPGGTICFIVNSYWTGSTAAKSLAVRMSAETTMDEVLLFGGTKLFRDVTGRHMVFRARKALDPNVACRVVDLSRTPVEQLADELSRFGLTTSSRLISQGELWRGGMLRVESIRHDLELPSDGPALGEVFDVRQGIAENPPFVTSVLADELGHAAWKGRGVFVLTELEITAMRLSDAERSLLRPYFTISAISRFALAPQPSHLLLYLTRRSAPTLEALPGLARHLAPFREMLERRREVRSGKLAWWHLHWPREERLFTAPRVLCVQMGHVPRFVFAERPTFVGFSLNIIVERLDASSPFHQRGSAPSLKALSAILNSRHAQHWFESNAKRRGANLDISGTVLKQFPLPSRHSPEFDARLCQLVHNWPSSLSESHNGGPSEQDSSDMDRLHHQGLTKSAIAETELERLVTDWYGATFKTGASTTVEIV